MSTVIELIGQIGPFTDWWTGQAEIHVNDTAGEVARVLDGLAPDAPVEVIIDSSGGTAKDCLDIHRRLKAHAGPVTVTIRSIAAGGAAWIAMAGAS